MIQIRRAELREIPQIMEFIRNHWKENHILGTDEDFFRWMYVKEKEVNFNLAIDEEQHKIYGINGFFLFNDDKHPDIIGSMWKVIPSEKSGLGLILGEYARNRWQPRYLFSIGLNQKAVRIEKLYGSTVAEMKHWYILAVRSEYQLAVVKNVPVLKGILDSEAKVEEIYDFGQFEELVSDTVLRKNVPYRNHSYIHHRYFEHPVYNYQYYQIKKGNHAGVFVCREVEYEGTKICKIVDWYGEDELIASSYSFWKQLIEEKGYEYIDFYCYGIAPVYLEKGGFSIRTSDSENIIPNYFEPFEQKNVEIKIVVYNIPGFHMYRGDGDQDRPSNVPKLPEGRYK